MILRIKNKKVEFYNDFKLKLSYDSIASSFNFNYYLDPENPLHVDLSHVGHYHKCSVEYENQTLLSGRLISLGFKTGPRKEFTGLSGYSLPGVLNDCSIAPEDYPLQTNGLSLLEIARKFTSRFGISIQVDNIVSSVMNAPIEETTAKEGQTVYAYLRDLCNSRNVIMSHTLDGKLLFTRATPQKTPVMDFGEGLPGLEYSLKFNGQQLHSHITVMKEADDEGGNAGQTTIRNPFVPFTFRPKVITQDSGSDIDTETAAKTALASELKNIKIQISMEGWEDSNGDLLLPGKIVSILNKDLFIFERTNLFVESVEFSGDSKQKTSVLECVLPSVYDGSNPVNIFENWQ
jgi:prophage tail gpP-like protein